MSIGTLYGVGVGPGDPELLTLKAAKVLRGVPVILAAASPKNDDSLALSIAGPHLPDSVEVVRLDFPMTRERAVLEDAWEKNARLALSVLEQGTDAAFLTLGDPLVYSTFGYLLRTLLRLAPDLPVEIVPGITSYQAAAARTRTVLCEGGENLILLSGVNSRDELARALDVADSAVILKAYRNAEGIRQALEAAGRGKDAVFVSRLGLEGEASGRGLEAMPEQPHYLSLLLTPPKR